MGWGRREDFPGSYKPDSSRRQWKLPPQRVIAPYAKEKGSLDPPPEYHGTREILWEAGVTTLQG